MSKITALRARKGRRKRVNIYLDGVYAFSLETDVAVKEGLRVDQELSLERIAEITSANDYRRCYDAAVLFISYRPRSEPELRERLHRRNFPAESIDAVVTRMKEQGLVDDTAFAQFWTENRDSFSPRSRWLTGMELRRKGVSEAIIQRTVGTLDDDDSAYRAAYKKARNLPRSDYQSFRRRLGEHLQRRGFGYGVINDTVKRLWNELDSELK
ncbi:MAG: RecX family transcriptional regulator [Dehalococcoidales bacterium]|nr:MAG: RecX family transcriptional regulator [Dehalococcoidales bacterium]